MAHGTGDSTGPALPREPIHRILGPLARFLHIEAAGGVVLLGCTLLALILANSPFAEAYLGFWKTEVGFRLGGFEMFHSLKHWINDGLMALFFFVVGLEVKREMVLGELREFRRAALPIAAAIGGMVVPAGIYLALQGGEAGARGWGIPMATDIAFVVGCMAILGSRVPPILRVVLLSLAIVDDIGAILVIAVGYTSGLDLTALFLGFAGIAIIYLFARIGVRNFIAYTVIGSLVWLCFHESGIHATIAGVIIGLMTPARSYISEGLLGDFLDRATQVVRGEGLDTVTHRAIKIRELQRATRESISPLEYLENLLHPYVGFAIMPIFALANAGVPFALADFTHPVALAVMAGLVLGKPAGILLFSGLALLLGLRRLPGGITWPILAGGGFLAGIGFTMALFIASLALESELLDAAKVGVLGGSALAAAIGMIILVIVLPKKRRPSA
jgi:NhaA family Na+:H+ antiporter